MTTDRGNPPRERSEPAASAESGGAEEARRRARLIGFAKAKAEEARAHQAARESSAAVWRGGTAAEHEAARALAEKQSGHPMRRHSTLERIEIANKEARIAAKYAEEAATFDAIAAALARPPLEPREPPASFAHALSFSFAERSARNPCGCEAWREDLNGRIAIRVRPCAPPESSARPPLEAPPDSAETAVSPSASAIAVKWARWEAEAAESAIYDAILGALAEERAACERIAYEAFRAADRFSDACAREPVAMWTDAAARDSTAATWAHVAHSAHDIAAAIRGRAAKTTSPAAPEAKAQAGSLVSHVCDVSFQADGSIGCSTCYVLGSHAEGVNPQPEGDAASPSSRPVS